MARTKKKTKSRSSSRKSKKKDLYSLILRNKILVIVVGGVIIIFTSLLIFLAYTYLFSSKEENTINNPENIENNTTNDNTKDTDSEKDKTADVQDDKTNLPKLINSITDPTELAEVNGKIQVAGLVSGSLSPLSIRIYDDNDTLLGESTISLSENDLESVYTWSKEVFVKTSPKTEKGYIQIFPQSEGESSQYIDKVQVTFKVLTSPNRIKLYSPLPYQLLSGGSVLFRGEMKDFFEATMAIRLKDEAGNVIFSDNITASSDNYSKYSPFSIILTYSSIPENSGITGSWELYEVSMADGSETILLTIPITLHE